MRSGLATVLGRPNTGKSTLVNRLVGEKVTITADRPNTTRRRVRGVLHQPDVQVVLVDTPGLHRPKTRLGDRLNRSALDALEGVDVVVALVDATAPIGPGDRMVLARAGAAGGDGPALFVAVNKIDRAGPDTTLARLAQAAQALDDLAAEHQGPGSEAAEFFPVSARTGKGVEALTQALVGAMPEGPPLYPEDVVSDTPEALFVAELVREQLVRRTREELPHAIACRVTEWEWPHIKVEILVERDSQKGIVIGHRGEVLKAVGMAVREQLPEGAYLELAVRVDKHWQQRDDALDRLGY